jgi:hypothetical protein
MFPAPLLTMNLGYCPNTINAGADEEALRSEAVDGDF